ncbi:hypothetical protein HanPSC8_Chr09g0393761 [Helianthus annuus]|nr:hypothetical protein HanPSC8_Chr09g0393761 [Helianthus annuus]
MALFGIQNPTPVFSMVPSFGAIRPAGLIPYIIEEDKVILNNVQKIVELLTAQDSRPRSPDQGLDVDRVIQELLPVFPVYQLSCYLKW